MASYSHHSTTTLRERLPEVFGKFRRDGVAYRHMTSFVVFHGKSLKKVMTSSENYGRMDFETLFSIQSYVIAFIWWVNQLFTILGSLFIMLAVEGIILDFFDDVIKKNADGSKNLQTISQIRMFLESRSQCLLAYQKWGPQHLLFRFYGGGAFFAPPHYTNVHPIAHYTQG